jgi:pyridoxine/pyridoxamine 5'-phosphate oxidase
MKAKISKTSEEFSDQHFQGRTKEKNALAISSNQSQTLILLMKFQKIFIKPLKT